MGYCIIANTECKIIRDKRTWNVIKTLPVEESKQIMCAWQKLTGDNTKQINDIIEKHQAMINKIKFSEIVRKVAWKGFIEVLWSSVRFGHP